MADIIRVVLADDHTLFRRGLQYLLEAQADMRVVGEAADGESCLRVVEEQQPAVLLMDIAMPGLDGIAATRIITSRWPAVRVVGLTMLDNDSYFFRLLEAGAIGYLLKGADPVDLLQAVRVTSRGQTYLDPALARLLVNDYRRQWRQKSDAVLSEREEEVLRLIAAGKTGREIAAELCISAHTVERHRSNLLNKLGVHNRVELLQYAIRRGLLQISDLRVQNVETDD